MFEIPQHVSDSYGSQGTFMGPGSWLRPQAGERSAAGRRSAAEQRTEEDELVCTLCFQMFYFRNKVILDFKSVLIKDQL